MNTKDTTTDTQQPIPFPDSPAGDSKELENIRAENARLKEQLRLKDAHDHLTHKLKKAGARTPKLLLGAVKEALKYTADGMLSNAGELVDDLIDRFPEQFRSNRSAQPHISIDAGSGQVTRPTLTREALAKMKPDEIAKLDWAEVRRALSN